MITNVEIEEETRMARRNCCEKSVVAGGMMSIV